MIKSLLMILFFCLICTTSNAQDDRYFNSAKVYKQDAIKKVKHKRIAFARRYHHKPLQPRKPAGLHFLVNAAQAATTPVRRISEAVIHAGRPSGCPPRAWCGCWLAKHTGLNRRELWLARNWARLGSATAPSPGAIVVFARGRGGHVGKITAVEGNRIKVLSGNDGRMVRERWRTMAGVIAVRRI